MESPAKNSNTSIVLHESSRPIFKNDVKKRRAVGSFKNRMSNMKKKIEELCILCGTDGFLISSSPSLGFKTWPENRDTLLEKIQKYRDSRKKRKVQEKEGEEKPPESEKSGEKSGEKDGNMEALLMGIKEDDPESRMGNLLHAVSGHESLEGLKFRDLTEIVERINLAQAAVRKRIKGLEMKGKGSIVKDEEGSSSSSKDEDEETLDLGLAL